MSALHAVHRLYEVVRTIRDAPEEIQALQGQAQLLENILPRPSDVLQREDDSISIALLVSKARNLTLSVDKFLDKATTTLQGKRKVKKLKWLFNADEAKEFVEGVLRIAFCEESFASIHDHLHGSFTDVHAHLYETLAGVREAVQEKLTISLEVFMCTLLTSLSPELRIIANEQRRGESHDFDQYSILYDISDVTEAPD
ncbi:hypothetical protein PHLCEN_2v12102, partial [Hermanssonia centrifuga]